MYCVEKENKRSRRREISGSKDLNGQNEEEDDVIDDLASWCFNDKFFLKNPFKFVPAEIANTAEKLRNPPEQPKRAGTPRYFGRYDSALFRYRLSYRTEYSGDTGRYGTKSSSCFYLQV